MGQCQSFRPTIFSTQLEVLNDVCEIIPNKLYLSSVGPILQEMRKPFLREHFGITGILSISGRDGIILKNLEHLHLKLEDNRSAKLGEKFAVVIDFIGANKTVLVHCEAGKSRSATAVMAYLVAGGLAHSARDAFTYVKARRPIIEPNVGFIHDLVKFCDTTVPGNGDTDDDDGMIFLAEYWVQLCNLTTFIDISNPIDIEFALDCLREADFHSGNACVLVAQRSETL